WDFATGGAKPTRRWVPAGAVWFLTLGGSPDAREAWARRTWLGSISDPGDGSFRPDLDGGVALVGTWDGVLRDLT
ncbi:MAG: type III-B CRISPR module-associated Cmr3 family protein, partial [Myxococcota bacterium]